MANRQLRIVVGVTGGIAAYKSLSIVRAFVTDGHDVVVVATESALEFVGRASLEALSRNPVQTGLYDDVASVRHVTLGQTADLIVVAPATANSLANMAGGHAPDLLGNVLLAARCRIVVAPAMHTEMWHHPATQNNVEILRSRGVRVVGPSSGKLTGDDVGIGRMADPDEVVSACYATLDAPEGRPLAGKRILITGGGTHEALDPVRFIGNRSSGRQAVALAEAALSRGATVTFIHAYMDVNVPVGATGIFAGSAQAMHDAVMAEVERHDIVIMAAAVADYRPAEVSTDKIKKSGDGRSLVISLEETKDILAEISSRQGRQNIVVGFAAETAAGRQLEALAFEKLDKKGCDVLVANQVSWTQGIAAETNEVVIVRSGTRDVVSHHGDKLSVAHRILEELV